MANDISFSPGRLVYVAAMHILNNQYKFSNHGTLKALRDPSVKPIVDEINPVIAASDPRGNRTSKRVDSETSLPYWTVTTNFMPAYQGTGRNTRTKTGGTLIQAPESLTVNFNLRREWTLEYNIKDVPVEPDALAYMKKIVQGKVQPYGGVEGAKYGDKMAKLGLEIYRTIDETLFEPVNQTLLTSLQTGIGKNAAYPEAETPTATAPYVQVQAFDSAGKATEDVLEYFQQTMLQNKLKGRMIVVGGRTLSKYMAKQGIVAINSAGIDLAKMYATLPVIWYFDEKCDTILGANKCIGFDSAAAGLCTLPEHGPDGFVMNGTFANTSFGNIAVRIEQSANDPAVAGSGSDMFEMDLDFRAVETTDSKDYPVLNVTPSILYGLYKRPTGFFTKTAGNIMKDVTGIFGFELTLGA